MESQMKDPIQIVKATVAALNRGDIDEVLSFCDDQIVLWAPGPDLTGQQIRGKAELRDLLELSEDRWPNMWTSIDSIMGVGDRVAVELTTVSSEHGVSLIHPMAAFYTVQRGLIVEQRSYYDLRALETRLSG